MEVFLVIGGVGIALLVVALVLGDVIDGALGLNGIDAIAALDSDLFSTAALAGLIGGVGFGGALGLALSGSVVVGVVVGLIVGALLAWAAGRLTGTLRRQGGGEAPRTAALVGTEAQVITAIPADGHGQIRLRQGGHTRTLNARAAGDIAAGERVWISAVLSATSVEVQSTDVAGPPALL